jgi:hypothetical protein
MNAGLERPTIVHFELVLKGRDRSLDEVDASNRCKPKLASFEVST